MVRLLMRVLLLALLATLAPAAAAEEGAPADRARPALVIPRLMLTFPEGSAGAAPAGFLPGAAGPLGALNRGPEAARLAPLPGGSPLAEFYGHLADEAAGYAVWGSTRLHLDDPKELEDRSREISRAAERIVSRSSDDFLGRKFDALVDGSSAVARVRRALDHYTAVTFRGLNAALGESASPEESVEAAGRVPTRRGARTTARLQVDLHPKILLKTEVGITRARLELPLSGSEFRLTVSRPLSSRMASEFFAAYPSRSDGHPRAGVHLFITF